MKTNTNPTRGMKDYLPEDSLKREAVLNTIVETYRKYGYKKIQTPSVENLAILSDGDGGDNEKLTFKILKRGNKLKLDEIITDENSLTESALRYDLTKPLSRFYANNQAKLPTPFKVIQADNVWRAERPQKGRLRQFVQCDIDYIGEENSLAEIDLLLAASEALDNIGFKDFKFNINDRRILIALAKKFDFEMKNDSFDELFIVLDKLDKIGFEGVKKELVLKEYKSDSIEGILSFFEKYSTNIDIDKLATEFSEDILDKDILMNLKKVVDTVKNSSFDIEFMPSLVRGMGYYTGLIYEIEYKNYPGSIGGGGRYDNMIGKLLNNNNVSACGISFGFERIMDILEEENRSLVKDNIDLAMLYNVEENSFEVYKFANDLREKNPEFNVSVLKKGKKLGKQLKRLKENGFVKYLVFGENEVMDLK